MGCLFCFLDLGCLMRVGVVADFRVFDLGGSRGGFWVGSCGFA